MPEPVDPFLTPPVTPRDDRKPVPVMPMVEFDAGGTLTLETRGFPPEVLDVDTVSLLFAAGLTAPDPVGSPEQDSSSWLVVNGPVRFLVGTLDVGPKRGLKAIVRGLAVALHTGVRHVRTDKPPDATAADDDQLRPSRLSIEPDDDDDRGQLIVTAGDVAASIDDLIGQATHGTDVIITRDGAQAAVLVGWSWYTRRREQLARLSAAHWAGWRTGHFDMVTYGLELADLRRHGRLEQAARPVQGKPGDGDDDAY